MEFNNENENETSDYPLFPLTEEGSNRPIEGGEVMTIDTIIYNLNNRVFASSNNSIGQEYFKITKEEIENIQKKKTVNVLSRIIDRELKKNPTKKYNLTKHTLCTIDEIQAKIYVSVEDDNNDISSYFYEIISKNICYEEEEHDNSINIKDLIIYDNYGFDTIISLLEDVKFVQNNYKLLDYQLLSPEHMEEAIAQREFIPISQDKICTVCYEPTIEYTTCNHSICLKCRDKCIVQGKKMCPICRNSDLCIYPSSL